MIVQCKQFIYAIFTRILPLQTMHTSDLYAQSIGDSWFIRFWVNQLLGALPSFPGHDLAG